MRMPRIRFTIPGMMVAVAVLALLFAGVAVKLREQERHRRIRRWYDHKNRAYNIWHGYVAPWQSQVLPGGPVPGVSGTPPTTFHNAEWDRYLAGLPAAARAQYAAIERRYDYHVAMWAKWERAPLWSSVDPDPPPPPIPGWDGHFPF
jgi:hypothetical protein